MSTGFVKRFATLIIQVLVVWGLSTVLKANLQAYPIGILTIFCINAILAISWNLVAGFTGQFSMGHAGFMALGAYTSAILMMKAGWPFLPSLLAGGTLSGLAGFLIGFPSLRLVGDYLSVVTLGFQYIITAILNNTVKLTGGGLGLAGVPFESTLPVVSIILIITIWLVTNLVNSKHGRSFVSVKEDEIAARSVGIDTTTFKVMAFVISSFFAGIGGALIGHYMMYLHPDIFNYQKTVEIISMVILGGIGSLTGSLAGALGITLLPEIFRNGATLLTGWGLAAAGAFIKKGWTVFYALMFLVIMLTRPQGLIGRKELTWEGIMNSRLFKRSSRKEA